MPVSPSFSNLLVKEKRAATAALLLVLFVAVLPFFFSSGVSEKIPSWTVMAASDQTIVVNGGDGNHSLPESINPSQSLSFVAVDGSKLSSLTSSPGSTRTVQTQITLNVLWTSVALRDTESFTVTVSPLPPTSNDCFSNLTLLVYRPDGTIDLLGPFQSGANGSKTVGYMPEMIGCYTVRATYNGQFFASRNVTYLGGESQTATLNVLSEGVPVTPKGPRTWIVDDDGIADFHTIHEAIDVASSGDIVLVRSGFYREAQVTIKKPLTLAGEDPATVILGGDDGEGGIYGARIYVQNTTDVVVCGFTIRNGGGICSAFSNNTIITRNIVTGCPQGIILISAVNNTVSENVVTNCSMAIVLSSGSQSSLVSENRVTLNKLDAIFVSQSNNNSFVGNYVAENGLGTQPGYHIFGIHLSYSNSNAIYHNDLVNNYEQAYSWNSFNNTWDNAYPSGGNYWSNYNGTDANHDGIGDTSYIVEVNNRDRYPFMSPFNLENNVQPIISISVQPNPVVTGNTLTLSATVTPAPPTTADHFSGLVFSFIHQSGSLTVLGPRDSDSSGHLSMSYDIGQIGNYQIKLTYSGQHFVNSNVTYLAAQSALITLTVEPKMGPRTWIVDDDGPADFRSIQEAINVAQDGDRIQVMAGSYFENLSIDKPITLQGVNPELTTLYGGIIIKTSGIVVDSLRRVGPGKWDRLHTYSYGVQTLSNQSLSLGQRQDVWGTVVSNCVFDNWVIPIFLGGGDGSKIVNNTIFNSDEGIDLDTFDNHISNNKINVGGWGISIGDEYVSGNHLFGNQISGGLGIEINWFNRNNTVEGNTISGCRYGIHLGAYSEGYGPCSENLIFHNNFLNNVQQVFLGSGSADVWDNGYLLGGNYWSDYRGIDANKDGSGDTPYVIDSKNVDRYPLMSIWNVTSAEQVANG